MKYKTIVSNKNELIVDTYKLINNNLYSKQNKKFVIEKLKLFLEAHHNKIEVVTLFVWDKKIKEIELKLKQIKFDLSKVVLISENVCNHLTDNVSANYVFAVCVKPNERHLTYRKQQNVLLLDNLQDPGNLGCIIRSGFALGMDLIILNNCVSIYNNKVIKASMGASFKPNLFELKQSNTLNALSNYQTLRYDILAMGLDDKSISLSKFKFKKHNNLIIMGNEGHGISEQILSYANHKLKIDMDNDVESLNVAMATAIVCYCLKTQK